MPNPSSAPSPEERYAAVARVLLGKTGAADALRPVAPRNRFGASALKRNGRIFAMLVRGRLVLKLPRARVDALVAAGLGERFDPRRNGRLMKEWLVLAPAADKKRRSLAWEAHRYAGKTLLFLTDQQRQVCQTLHSIPAPAASSGRP